MTKTLNEIAQEVHSTAKEKGWWFEERNSGELVALMHSELSEALEEMRNKRPLSEVYYSEGGKPEGVPVELADCIIRILDFCGKHNIDMDEAVRIKMEYNKTRPNRHGGKAF